jgi:hypothetical protein
MTQHGANLFLFICKQAAVFRGAQLQGTAACIKNCFVESFQLTE